MKKIIEKIKVNKNLCKGLKIFKLVLDCLVYGFAIFMIIGLAVGQSYNHKENQTQVRQLIPNVVTTPVRKGAVELNNGGYLYNILEFVNRFIESPMRVNEFKDLEVNQYIIYNGLYNYMYANQSNMNMGQGNFDIQGVNIGSILGQVKSDEYYWYNSTLPTRNVDYNFYSTPSPDDNNKIFSISVGYIKTSMAQLEQWSYTQVQINELDRTYFVYDSNANGDFLGLRMSHYGDYKNGYDTGYQQGYFNGYNNGYSQGSTGMSNNPFNLLKSAFGAIADILNIQIIPNVPLGVLIFAPLLVVSVIALVKLFRG